MVGVEVQALPKAATGIAGFDSVSRGGVPRKRTTLLHIVSSSEREKAPRRIRCADPARPGRGNGSGKRVRHGR